MKFLKLVETRFADPITALDLSNKYVCFGSAMGRIAFFSIPEQKELVLFDSQPELIRGISHSPSGNKIYVAIGDLCFHSLDAETLASEEPTYIVEDMEQRTHKATCERSYTLNKKHMGCVLTINMNDKAQQQQNGDLKPINIVNLETKHYERHCENGEVEFNQNSVPFDFDGNYVLWLEYEPMGVRTIYAYSIDCFKKEELLRFDKSAGIISHACLAEKGKRQASSGPLQDESLRIFYVQNCTEIIMYDVKTKATKLIGTSTSPVLAMHVQKKGLRMQDIKRAGLNISQQQNGQQDLEAGNLIDNATEFLIVTVDENEFVTVFDTSMTSPNAVKPSAPLAQLQIQQTKGAPVNLAQRDLFALGYPYFVCIYDTYIAITSDFGVIVLQLDQ